MWRWHDGTRDFYRTVNGKFQFWAIRAGRWMDSGDGDHVLSLISAGLLINIEPTPAAPAEQAVPAITPAPAWIGNHLREAEERGGEVAPMTVHIPALDRLVDLLERMHSGD